MRSLVGPLPNITMSLYEGEIYTGKLTCTQGDIMWTWRQKSGWCICKLQNTKNFQQTTSHSESSIEQSPHKEPMLLTPWSQTSGLQNCETVNFGCLSHPVYGICYGSLSKLIWGPSIWFSLHFSKGGGPETWSAGLINTSWREPVVKFSGILQANQ